MARILPPSEFPLEGAVEYSGKDRRELGGGLGLHLLQCMHPRLHTIEIRCDTALFL